MSIDIEYHSSAAVIIIVLNTVSFISLVFVLSIYLIRWKKISSFPLRLMKSFYLCIACLAQNLSVLMYNPVSVNNDKHDNNIQAANHFCIFQAILKVSSDLSSIIWTMLIIYSSFASIVLKKNLENAEISYLIFGYLFSVLVAIMQMFTQLTPVFFKVYGFDTYYCWFQADDLRVEFGLKMGYYFVPLWLGFWLTAFMSVRVYRELRELGLEERELVFFKRLMLFPLIMLGTALFPTINLIYSFITENYPEWMDDFTQIATGIYGLLNSIAYGFNPVIREQMMICLRIKKEEAKDDAEMIDLGTRYSRNTSRLSDLFRQV